MKSLCRRCFLGKAVDQVLYGGIQDVADSALPDILLDGGQFSFADDQEHVYDGRVVLRSPLPPKDTLGSDKT